MKKRIITGLLIFLALAGFVALRFVHLLFFDALVLAISCAAGWEMICAYKLADRKSYNAIVFLFPFVIWFCYFFAKDGKTAIVYQFLAMLIVFVLCFVIELLSYKNKNKKNVVEPSSQDLVDNKYLICETFTTLKICFYPLLLVGTLFGINHLGLEMGLIGILLAIAVATFSDMFAFFFGVAFGQGKNCKKLCPHISWFHHSRTLWKASLPSPTTISTPPSRTQPAMALCRSGPSGFMYSYDSTSTR